MPRGNIAFAQAKALEKMYGDKWVDANGFHHSKKKKVSSKTKNAEQSENDPGQGKMKEPKSNSTKI